MIRSSINMTLDGFCDHEYVVADDEHHRYACDLVEASDTLLLGRVSYELFANNWPQQHDDLAQTEMARRLSLLLHTKPKLVASRSERDWSWHNSSTISSVDASTLEHYRGPDGKDLLVFGSPSIVRTLLIQGLLDELQICMQPFSAESGAHSLFAKVPEHMIRLMKLQEMRNFSSGVTCVRYSCARGFSTSL